MKKIITNKISKKLLSKRGETIMETLVSLLIMGLLITSLLSIIRFSMVLTGDSLANANRAQTAFNGLRDGTNYNTTATRELRFTIVMPTPLTDNTTAQVNVYPGNNIFLTPANEITPRAFIPVPAPTPGP